MVTRCVRGPWLRCQATAGRFPARRVARPFQRRLAPPRAFRRTSLGCSAPTPVPAQRPHGHFDAHSDDSTPPRTCQPARELKGVPTSGYVSKRSRGSHPRTRSSSSASSTASSSPARPNAGRRPHKCSPLSAGQDRHRRPPGLSPRGFGEGSEAVVACSVSAATTELRIRYRCGKPGPPALVSHSSASPTTTIHRMAVKPGSGLDSL
jgi:hypothetical protein